MQGSCSSSASNSRLENCEEFDRISNLPEPILHHILSFLPTEEAIKTCVLSKSWNSTWISFPILKFDQFAFFRDSKACSEKVTLDFCEYVHKSINRRKQRTETTIQRFKLRIFFHNVRLLKDHSPDLDSWMNYAITNNVEKLILQNYGPYESRDDGLYILPLSLFRAKSLKKLKLIDCRFEELIESSRTLSTNNRFGFSLKTLKLSYVSIPQQMFQNMLSNCRLLEKLSIKFCRGFKTVKIESSLTRLKRACLCLDRLESQIIAINEVPNLQSLRYAGDSENVLNSIKASKYNKNVKELKLKDVIDLNNELLRVVMKEVPMLEKLELKHCSSDSICISSDRLLELSIYDAPGFQRLIELDTRALKRFRCQARRRSLPFGLWNASEDLIIELVP